MATPEGQLPTVGLYNALGFFDKDMGIGHSEADQRKELGQRLIGILKTRAKKLDSDRIRDLLQQEVEFAGRMPYILARRSPARNTPFSMN